MLSFSATACLLYLIKSVLSRTFFHFLKISFNRFCPIRYLKRDNFDILSKAFVFVKNFFIFLLLFVSHSSASLRQLIYVITFKLFCQPLFNNSYKFLLVLLISCSFELSFLRDCPPPRLPLK